MEMKKKIPVILDTDIAGDIDDTWALGFLLRCPEFDVKLVVTALENKEKPLERAKITAKQIDESGYKGIAVGAGLPAVDYLDDLGGWGKDYDVSKYPGEFYEDGVQAMIDTIMASDEEVLLMCMAPLTNIAEALRREPRIAEKARVVSVMGSIYSGHNLDKIEKQSDYNVRADIPAARKMLEAPWDITIVPLDVTACIVLGDDNYQKILAHRESDPVIKSILSCFDTWMEVHNCTYYKTHSTCLYDTAAVYIGATGDYNVIMEDHKLTIDDGGYTNDDENGKLVHCAVYWKYKDMFYKFMTDRLCSGN